MTLVWVIIAFSAGVVILSLGRIVWHLVHLSAQRARERHAMIRHLDDERKQ